MSRRHMVKLLVYTAAFLIFFRYYFLFLERRALYHPYRTLEATPEAIGLAYEDVYITTPDSVQIHGWYIPRKESQCTILFCHGNAGNISHRLYSLQMLHDIGFTTLIFDYRGYGKSTDKPSEEGLYLDALSCYQFLLKQKGVKPEQVVVFGRSLGGAVGIELCTRVTVGTLICDSSFTSVVAMGKDLFPFLPVKFLARERYDSLSKLHLLNVPTLFIHSRDDEIIPFYHGKSLFEHAPEPKEFLEMRGSHNEAVIKMGERYPQTIKDFIEKALAIRTTTRKN